MNLFTVEQLEADVRFLLARAGGANCCRMAEEGRDTGMSSNSIVSIAYGEIGLDTQVMPFDRSDLAACQRAWVKLPEHRKNQDAREALRRAIASLNP